MSNRRRPRQEPTTLVVSLDVSPTPSYSVFQGSAVNTATDLATAALPTQLVFDSSVVGTPIGVPTANVPAASTSTAGLESAAPTSTPESTPAPSTSSSHNNLPVAAIIMAMVAAAAIASLFAFLWYRKRARRRGHSHTSTDSHDVRGPPASDVLRKLGPAYDKSDPFSDAHAEDPFADPEKAEYAPVHNRSGSDSFLSMSAPRQPYTHAASASTGSTASGKIRKKEVEDARQRDMLALNNLVRALDHKERVADQEGRDRKSLPPIELFKAALVR